MGPPWVVHEGYLLCRPPDATTATTNDITTPTTSRKLLERYVVLYVNRKMEFFEAAAPEPADSERKRVSDALFVGAFAGWDGAGLLRAGEAYGLELRVDPKPHGSGRHTTSLCVAAFNRVDLDKWVRALVAVLDPQSAAGEEVRRDRRRVRREEKRVEAERDEKVRKWRELKLKQAEDERERLLAREEEINNMTPLERVDGLGSLDDDTLRLLEKRKLRLQRRHAPTTGRVNKAAYRKRMEDGAGGKLENVQPLQPKLVETKARVRVELPLPGHFFEAADVSSTHRIGLPTVRRAVGSNSSDSTPSDTSSVSSTSLLSSGNSGSSSTHLRHASNGTSHPTSAMPPPPPPPPHALLQAMQRDAVAPPPRADTTGFVALDDDLRLSRAPSFRGSLYDPDDMDDVDDDTRRSHVSRASFAQSSRRLSGVDRAKHGVQDSLAAILSGRRPTTTSSGRRDSIASVTSELSTMRASRAKTKSSGGVPSKPPASPEAPATISNAFAASLAAIRRNRADTMDETSSVSPDAKKVRSRKRESQLSAEGKELLKKAISNDNTDSPGQRKATATATAGGRKGLFDDSSSESDGDSDRGLFAGAKKRNGQTTTVAAAPPKPVTGKPDRHSSTTPTSSHSSVGPRRPSARDFALDDDDDDSDSDVTDASRSEYGGLTSNPPRRDSVVLVSTRQPPTAVVSYVSSTVQPEGGKKPAGFYTFALRLGAHERKFTHSYNELEAIHLRLAMDVPGDALPKFPPKHRLRNNTKPENMQKRAIELVAYFQQLLAVAGVVESQRFRFEFGLPAADAEASTSVTNGSAAHKPERVRAPVSPVATTRSSLSRPTKATAPLFATNDDSDDSDSDSDASASPPSRVQPSRARASLSADEPSARNTTKPPSMKAVGADLEPPSSSLSLSRASRRPSSTASRAATSEAPAPVATPKITGLPPRPNLFGGGRGDLLAAIRNGAELRKTDEAAAGTGSSTKNGTLALAPKSNAAAATSTAPAGSINDAITNAMAARRIHVEFEEAHSDNDDDDSDDDWD